VILPLAFCLFIKIIGNSEAELLLEVVFCILSF